MEIRKKHKSFGGESVFASHSSHATSTTMSFSYFKPQEEVDSAIIWLSGLTCTEENFITKAGVQSLLAGTKTMIICPDTSPRGLDIEGADESYDFGSGASFYVNATQAPYRENYQMDDYITKDIVSLIKEEFGIEKISIMGHSMGGHGALVLGLRNPEVFRCISAFSPIVNPMNCDWGKKALKGYLGEDQSSWKEYDACELIKSGKKHDKTILIHQGLADEFYPSQLLTENLEEVCKEAGQELQCQKREGYDHSYYFISTFLNDHIQHHLKYLK